MVLAVSVTPENESSIVPPLQLLVLLKLWAASLVLPLVAPIQVNRIRGSSRSIAARTARARRCGMSLRPLLPAHPGKRKAVDVADDSRLNGAAAHREVGE